MSAQLQISPAIEIWENTADCPNSAPRAGARAQGGEESIARHHAKGKLTLRERIHALLDENTFRETGPMAGGATLNDADEVDSFDPANYILGAGDINARTVVVGGGDSLLD